MIRRQDFSILIFYFLGYSKIRNATFRLQHKPRTRIVTFHDIPPESLGGFEANLLFLKRKTNVVSFADYFENKLSTKKINVVITFDDGYESWVSYALPVLQYLGLPATFFITSGFVGLSKTHEAEFMRQNLSMDPAQRSAARGLTLEDLKRIADQGFTVGGHTLSHRHVETFRDRTQVRQEIGGDKLLLERMTGVKVEYFAFPSGVYYNPTVNVVELLRELGYKGAVTTIPGFNDISSPPYLLRRELTAAAMPGIVFRARVLGNYDGVMFFKKLMLKEKDR